MGADKKRCADPGCLIPCEQARAMREALAVIRGEVEAT
jgi:hypothetical protein